MTQAVRSGRIPAYCVLCGHQFSQAALSGDTGHVCLRDAAQLPKYPVGLRLRDVERFKIDSARQANGRRTRKSREKELR